MARLEFFVGIHRQGCMAESSRIQHAVKGVAKKVSDRDIEFKTSHRNSYETIDRYKTDFNSEENGDTS